MKVTLPLDAAFELTAADIERDRYFLDAEQMRFQRLRLARTWLDSHRHVVFRDNRPAAGAVDLSEIIVRLFGKEIAAQLRASALPQ